MKKYYSKDALKMKQYNIMLTLARDKTSTLYNTDGSQNMGASHRGTFWHAFNHGWKYTHRNPEYTCISYCVFRAGIDFKAEINVDS